MPFLLALPPAVITRLDLVWQGLDLDVYGTFAHPPSVPSVFIDQRRARNRLIFALDSLSGKGLLMMAQLESKFQAGLIKEIKDRLPGCYVLKNDAGYIQGIPDLLILYKKRWGALECKRSAKSSHQPNQDYHVKAMNDMSYASFIFPENKEEILDEMVSALRPRRKTRVSGSE